MSDRFGCFQCAAHRADIQVGAIQIFGQQRMRCNLCLLAANVGERRVAYVQANMVGIIRRLSVADKIYSHSKIQSPNSDN